jgi:hypothetical protein
MSASMCLQRDWLELFPPIYQKVMHRMVKQKSAGGPSMFNLGVSSVAGRTAPLYLEGARLYPFYSRGQIIEGMGLNTM